MQSGKRSTARAPFSQEFDLSVQRVFWFYAAAGIYEMASTMLLVLWFAQEL
jgi:hypothetical protein